MCLGKCRVCCMHVSKTNGQTNDMANGSPSDVCM